MSETNPPEKLLWQKLSVNERAMFERKLQGLYGARSDEEAFDSLEIDKQQALFLVAHRLLELGLWDSVRRVENIYGKGGVGMSFRARPELASMLQRRKDFTTRFARHKGCAGGFLERGQAKASLHFLYHEKGERLWAVHFDLYNPWSSPLNALRHLIHEKIRGMTPDWRIVRAVINPSSRFWKETSSLCSNSSRSASKKSFR